MNGGAGQRPQRIRRGVVHESTTGKDTAVATIGESEFDRATRLIDGVGQIVDGWDVGGNANGGYLLAMAARGMAAEAGRPHPITVTGHYLAPGRPGPVTLDAEVVRAGRRFATVRATLQGAGGAILEVLGSFGDLDGLRGGFSHVHGSPPPLDPPASCVELAAGAPALMSKLDVRVRPGDVGFGVGRPSGVAEVAGWFGFADGRPVDPLALLLVSDAMPPAVFNLDLRPGWVPTVELTVHVRAVPAPGPLRCVFRTRFVQHGCLEEDGEVWDSTGELVAQSRQLGLLPRG